MKNKFIIFIIILFCIPVLVYAVSEKPPGSSNISGSSSSVSYKGATTFSSSVSEESKSYSSTQGSQNALLVSGGVSTIKNPSITKSGDSDGDNADFYGTNAAVLTYNNATLNIEGGTITTNGSHANAVFAYGTGIINISNTKINTTSNNSGGIMVTGGGTLTANSCTVKTTGNSSASIRSDRGGGTLTVNGGTYETNGVGSPAIYSTANIIVNDANLISTSSEGLVVEGANLIEINNTKVTDTNNSLNGNSETYKNVFLYQSMSGDAESGTASFKAKNSTLITNKGDTIFVTNTTATIELENNTITNNDGDFLRIQTGKWGKSGSNGGNVTLTMSNQKIDGNIIVDSISTLEMKLSNSVFNGSINNENKAKNINLTLSSDSVLSLTQDTYLDSLKNSTEDNSNIYSNGEYKLFVDGKEVTINSKKYEEENEVTHAETKEENTEIVNESKDYIIYISLSLVLISIVVLTSILIIKNKKRKVN